MKRSGAPTLVANAKDATQNGASSQKPGLVSTMAAGSPRPNAAGCRLPARRRWGRGGCD
jgi:hypothetical protein